MTLFEIRCKCGGAFIHGRCSQCGKSQFEKAKPTITHLIEFCKCGSGKEPFLIYYEISPDAYINLDITLQLKTLSNFKRLSLIIAHNDLSVKK